MTVVRLTPKEMSSLRTMMKVMSRRAVLRVMYSASVVERVMTVCILEAQISRQPAYQMMYPVQEQHSIVGVLSAPTTCEVSIHVALETAAFVGAHNEAFVLGRLEVSYDAFNGLFVGKARVHTEMCTLVRVEHEFWPGGGCKVVMLTNGRTIMEIVLPRFTSFI
jgi:hypothetical protein